MIRPNNTVKSHEFNFTFSNISQDVFSKLSLCVDRCSSLDSAACFLTTGDVVAVVAGELFALPDC